MGSLEIQTNAFTHSQIRNKRLLCPFPSPPHSATLWERTQFRDRTPPLKRGQQANTDNLTLYPYPFLKTHPPQREDR